MKPLLILLVFAAIAMATIVLGDLRDSRTHRWKTVQTPRQRLGAFILFLDLVAFGAMVFLLK